MIELKESKTRDIPLWLTALVILLCIGGGAWLVKWYMKEQPRQVVTIPDDKVVPTGNRGTWRGQTGGNNNNGGNNGFRAQPQRDITLLLTDAGYGARVVRAVDVARRLVVGERLRIRVQERNA